MKRIENGREHKHLYESAGGKKRVEGNGEADRAAEEIQHLEANLA